ncbi:MAG: hypothetical protein ACI8RZ_000094 [Myxococcota bacterium]|jgi:hypothetical protein
MLLLLLTCAATPPVPERIAAAAVTESCQLCIFQRDGALSDILKRLIWEVPVEDIEFGHCFACVRCPGEDGLSDCRGFSPVDLDAAEYPPQPGHLYLDDTDPWTRVDCRPLLPGQAERLWSYALSYDDEHPYQVINKKGGRSCLGFCADVAAAAGMSPRQRAGDLTVPGAMRFPDATFSLDAPNEMTAAELTDALVKGR